MKSPAAIRRALSGLACLPALALASAGCDGDPAGTPDPEVAQVQVTPASATLETIGATRQLTALALDDQGNEIAGISFTWTSADMAVVTVDDTGLVEARGEGEAQVTAEAQGVTGTATLTVEVAVSEVEVTPAQATVQVGGTTSLEATARGPAGNELPGAQIVWSSSDEAVATVDDTGVVTGQASGTAIITAESEGVAGTAEITVTAPVASVEVAPATAELTAVDATVQLDATVTDTEGGVVDDAVVEWASSDEVVATVDGTGLVTARGDGTATITASVGDVSGGATVTVAVVVSSVVVSPDPAEVEVGATTQLTARAEDANGNAVADATFTWTSDDGTVATVDGTGLVSGVAEGTTTITATTGGVSGTATLEVVAPALPTLALVSGDDQNGRTERAFDAPLVVRVTDADDQPVGGVTVEWAVTGGEATLSEASTDTDAQGEAAVTVTSETSTGEIEVRATAAATQGGPVDFTLHTTVIVVEIVDLAFVDLEGRTNADFVVDMEVGDTIEWRYVEDGTSIHTATSTAEPAGGSSFDSGNMNPGDTFRFAPQVEGSWTYFCEIHPTLMVDATINVALPASGLSARPAR